MDKNKFLKSRIPVVEIFNSISGEGISAGEIYTFVRTAGCNLRCEYCDTKYSYDEGSLNNEMMTPDEILSRVMEIGCSKVLCTGGEPLEEGKAKRYLPIYLSSKGLKVRIESNGSCPVYTEKEIKSFINTMQECSLNYVLDVKCPCSGMAGSNIFEENFKVLKPGDELKFVVGNSKDIDYTIEVLDKYKEILSGNKVAINYSPVFGMCDPKDLVEILKEKDKYFACNDLNVRLSLQVHKYIWPPDKRGV